MIFHKNWDNSSWCVFTLKGESCLSVRSQLMPISLLVTIWEQKEILLLGSTNVTLTGSKLLLCTCSSVLLLWLEVHTNNKVTLLCRALVALDMLGKLYLMTWYQSWNFIVSHMKFNWFLYSNETLQNLFFNIRQENWVRSFQNCQKIR